MASSHGNGHPKALATKAHYKTQKSQTSTNLKPVEKGRRSRSWLTKPQPDDRARPGPALQPRLCVQWRAAELAQEPLLPEDGPHSPLEPTALKHTNGGKSPRHPRKWNGAGGSRGRWAFKAFATPPSVSQSLCHLESPRSHSPDPRALGTHTQPLPGRGPTPDHPSWACTIPQPPPPPFPGEDTEGGEVEARESRQRASWRRRSSRRP